MEERMNSRLHLRVLGMRRSGNHAIINWVLKQASGATMHLNNIKVPGDPWETCDNDPVRPDGPLDLLLYSYEDVRPKRVAQCSAPRKRAGWFGTAQRHCTIIILRNPANMFASRLRSGFTTAPLRYFDQADLWMLYAREFLGITRYLGEDIIPVSFDRWSEDREYRRGIAENLGIPFTDAGFDEVTAFGGGSSFEGTSLNKQASAMNVRQRYQHEADNPVFAALFRDPQLLEHARKVFPEFATFETFFAEQLAALPHGKGSAAFWDGLPLPLECLQDAIWKTQHGAVNGVKRVLPASVYEGGRRTLYRLAGKPVPETQEADPCAE